MVRRRKKIGLIFASGSLISIRGNKTVFFVDQEKDMLRWLSEVPEISLIAEINPFFIQGEDDAFTLNSIESMARMIAKNRDSFDGFVVTVRAEHLVQAAVAVEFMLQGAGKPIIFTGSRYSPEAIAEQDTRRIIKIGGLGLRSNIINATQVAASQDFPTTAIIFGNKIIKPTKAVYGDFYSMNMFKSLDDDYLGKVDFGITIHRGKVSSSQVNMQTKLSRDVAVVCKSIFASHDRQLLGGVKNADVLLMHVHENEKLDFKMLEDLREKYAVVLLFNEYYVLDHHGAILLSKMTWTTAVIKALWAREAAKKNDEFISMMRQPVINEFLNL